MIETSIWRSTVHLPTFPGLTKDKSCDVVVVGAGITGVTTALLLAREGKKVVVLERGKIGGAETGSTTAHLTEILDTRYSDLISKWGRKDARLVLESQRYAIHLIRDLTDNTHTACEFEAVPAFLYAEKRQHVEQLIKEHDALLALGAPVQRLPEAPLPFKTVKALAIPGQAKFHPLKYVMGLVEAAKKLGVCFYEDTEVKDIKDGEPCEVTTDLAVVRAKEVVEATNVPISNRVILQTKVAAYRTYAIGVILDEHVSDALYWDTEDPYHYIRNAEDSSGKIWIIGGSDHKTGTETDTEKCFLQLEAFTQERFSLKTVRYRWSGQIEEPVDGLPYIGRNPLTEHIYVATGYSGNGMTNGTLAAYIITETILGRANEWHPLYDPGRVKPVASIRSYIAENKDFPSYFILDRLKALASQDDENFQTGSVIRLEGKHVAISRDSSGEIQLLSAVCPHLGCIVHWNNSAETWDCPCHGSRFSCEGKVLNGPATTGLSPVKLEEETERKVVGNE